MKTTKKQMNNEVKKYQITLNERQLQLLSWGCDTLTRLIEGQHYTLQDLLESAWEKRAKKATGKSCDKEFEGGWYKMREDAEELVLQIRQRFWNIDRQTENGLHYDETADILWDIHQVLRHQLWQDRPEEGKSRVTVDAFPASQFGVEPLIEIKKL